MWKPNNIPKTGKSVKPKFTLSLFLRAFSQNGYFNTLLPTPDPEYFVTNIISWARVEDANFYLCFMYEFT